MKIDLFVDRYFIVFEIFFRHTHTHMHTHKHLYIYINIYAIMMFGSPIDVNVWKPHNSVKVMYEWTTVISDLHSYNLKWTVCHLFPKQRWRTHANIQSRETIGQENHVIRVYNYVLIWISSRVFWSRLQDTYFL